jgi:hypothetical protein
LRCLRQLLLSRYGGSYDRQSPPAITILSECPAGASGSAIFGVGRAIAFFSPSGGTGAACFLQISLSSNSVIANFFGQRSGGNDQMSRCSSWRVNVCAIVPQRFEHAASANNSKEVMRQKQWSRFLIASLSLSSLPRLKHGQPSTQHRTETTLDENGIIGKSGSASTSISWPLLQSPRLPASAAAFVPR